MNYHIHFMRASFAGATVWLLVIISFSVLRVVPGLKGMMDVQSIIVLLLTIFYSLIGSTIYYRDTAVDHGVFVGMVASATALLLDVFITVPFFEKPNGKGYADFFGSPVLWSLVVVNVAIFYLYGKRVRRKSA